MYDFDKLQNRRNSGCVKWDTGCRIFHGGEDFIPMWIADTDFATLPEITEAISKRLEHPMFGYCCEPQEFFKSIASWAGKRYGWELETDWINQVEGVVHGIALSINALTEEGDSVIVQIPCYDNFTKVIERNKRRIEANKLVLKDGKFEIDFEGLEKCMQSGAKVMLFCNPHNPTGRVWRRDELEKVAELCRKYDITVISDDIHCDVVHPGNKYTPIASLNEDMQMRTVSFYAPGKTFNTAALKTACTVIPNPELMAKFKEWQGRMFMPKLNVLSYETSIAAYTYGEGYAQELSAYIAENAKYAYEFIKENVPKIKADPIEGTYLMPWDCSALGLEGRALVMFFANNAQVGFSSGNSYSPDWGGWVRVNLACSRERLKEALRRVAEAVNNLPEKAE